MSQSISQLIKNSISPASCFNLGKFHLISVHFISAFSAKGCRLSTSHHRLPISGMNMSTNTSNNLHPRNYTTKTLQHPRPNTRNKPAAATFSFKGLSILMLKLQNEFLPWHHRRIQALALVNITVNLSQARLFLFLCDDQNHDWRLCFRGIRSFVPRN